MTAIVAIRCKDGVVIGADSSATFGDGQAFRTIEQTTDKKIQIVGNENKIIIAGTGFVGHHQRYVESVSLANAGKAFRGKSEGEFARELARIGNEDWRKSVPKDVVPQQIPYSAVVAYQANQKACLCELVGNIGFQPEVKQADDLWFLSIGSGQSITDPFLALFRKIFWTEAPDIKGGIFTAYWALTHACEVNPGGINYPVRMAVYGKRGSNLDAWMLGDDDLAETADLVRSASEHFATFRDVLLGKGGSTTPPPPPKP